MRYLHAMIRTSSLEDSLEFYCEKLGFSELRRKQVENRDIEDGRFTLVFLAAPGDLGGSDLCGRDCNSAKDTAAAAGGVVRPEIELCYNHEPNRGYQSGNNFGHLSYLVDDIYETCQQLSDRGVTINRPPKDGRLAFIATPENITLELIQNGEPLAPKEPWLSMGNTGVW